MDTKLTLKIEETIINRAKKYAKERGISLSKMIENYLQAVTNKQDKNIEISPLVESLIGVINIPDSDYKKNYSDHLSNKYK